ncbi:MAG: UDP-N-acetylglucosamine 2-epimerase (non-hydrolyzing) [candidate division WOR-3 bacterium]
MKKIVILVGARPNFMKAAPVYNELKKIKRFKTFIVHSGQHYDKAMSKVFFRDLALPKPKIYLGVGSGTHAEQTAKVMMEFEKVCFKEKPDLVIVVGDVNTTLAGALTAAKLCIPVAHVEAGLRSFDRTMPEEINRLLTDQISDFLFTTCEDANRNLLREGIAPEKIFFVGNTMIDSLLKHCTVAKKIKILEMLGLDVGRYGVVTLHRPSNVDDINVLQKIIDAISEISKIVPIVFPVHPRTDRQLDNIHFLLYEPEFKKGIKFTEPLGYLEFLSLMSGASIVLTDSGGIQEETTILGIPCLTLRENTERPITITQGTNKLVGNDPRKIIKEACKILRYRDHQYSPKRPKYWDGRAGKRIAKILRERL